MQIFLFQNEQQVGPYDEDQIRNFVASGKITEFAMVWHDGLSEWKPLNTIISFEATASVPPPIPKGLVNSAALPIACPTCGAPKWRASDPCQVCTNAHMVSMSRLQQPVTEKPKKIINKRGAWCPHCGNRNSYRKSSGTGCLTLGILLVSVIGILFIPFLPKTWHCRECGNSWR